LKLFISSRKTPTKVHLNIQEVLLGWDFLSPSVIRKSHLNNHVLFVLPWHDLVFEALGLLSGFHLDGASVIVTELAPPGGGVRGNILVYLLICSEGARSW